MSHGIPTYLLNRSLGLGTSTRESVLVSKPTAATQSPRYLGFNIENFDECRVYQKDVIGHYGCVNAIEFSPNEELVASGGDDRRIVIWATDELLYSREPKMRGKMGRKHFSNIFALAFDLDSKVVYSAGNDKFFVASDVATGEQIYGMQGNHAAHDISVNMRSGEVLVTRCGGRDALYFYDPRTNGPTATISVPSTLLRSQLFSAQFNPDPSNHLIGVCGEYFGVRFMDRRKLTQPLFSQDDREESAMYGGWNKNGTKFAHLASGKAPILYDFKECAIYEMSSKRGVLEYMNMHTIKSIEWIDDDWLVTGSDDFNIYGWCTRNLVSQPQPRGTSFVSDTRFTFVGKKSSDTVPKACLVGHRSIVNHVRFSSRYQFLVSCGVEKIIKVWSTHPFPNAFEKPRLRKRGTTETEGEDTGNGNGGRRRKKKTDESRRMLRYFDSIIGINEGRVESDEDSEEDSLSSISDGESSSGVTSGEQRGVNRLVEDTNSTDGVERVPEVRVIIHGDRALVMGGEEEEEEEEEEEGRRRMVNVFGSDSSDDQSDVTMGSHDSDTDEEVEEPNEDEESPQRRAYIRETVSELGMIFPRRRPPSSSSSSDSRE
ncbi:hypothetical protein PMAYCL1PPCAC_29365 [Pristionchus mayeri]|uniref:WD40 domain-containing protein n=1 Tax=Pristionchus mayeri TaxID=1317129 RepID=A0AAN5DBK7_9BILA|nr:hypothetical protein PMAYCL1PPCAC_29365 [Pristionchus mayeri]